MKPSMFLKLVVTCFLMVLLIAKARVEEIFLIFQGLDVFYISIVFALTIASVIWSAYKWQVLLKARYYFISLVELTKIYFTGLFFNNFLPSSIGGDVMRIYQVGKGINSQSEAAASVILERLLASIGLAVVAMLALITNVKSVSSLSSTIAIFFAFSLLVVIIFIKPSLLRPFTLLKVKWWQKLISKLKEINRIIQSYRKTPFTLIKVIFYSVIFQIMVVIINYLLLKSMGINSVSLGQCMLLVPIISAISMVPISINGLGVREGAYVILFAPIGLSTAQAVTLSMLFFIIVTFVSLLGGIFFVLERGKGEYNAPKQFTST